MKNKIIVCFMCFMLLGWIFPTLVKAQEMTAKEIIKAADDKMQGKTNYAEMTMKVVRPTWEREVKFKSWGKDRNYSLTLITYPAKEKGQTFLKREQEMWNWNPTINRMIKLPPSMMSQGWMGSDYSNDDILKESSIVVDYEHSIIGAETLEGKECWKLQLIPKEEAAVVWGKIIKWITKDDYLQLKSEYYDEDNYLVKTDVASQIKMMGDREIPTYIEIIPADEPGKKTIVTIDKAEFDIQIPDDYFSQQYMKRVR
ncbi:MAG: outer membrane lipoprotein-sorting protein [Bacteroidales bacterium]|nr:outer membrane lipoprotein-sorting protein [Bacteroidales bacterium]MCF8455264.1 outer membrane lipoprotein-sorting protein [Bacteroidales bacterium]